MRNETRDKQVTRCKTERKKVVWKAPGTVAHVRSKFARGISTLFFFQVEIFARIKKRGEKITRKIGGGRVPIISRVT